MIYSQSLKPIPSLKIGFSETEEVQIGLAISDPLIIYRENLKSPYSWFISAQICIGRKEKENGTHWKILYLPPPDPVFSWQVFLLPTHSCNETIVTEYISKSSKSNTPFDFYH